MDGLRRQKELQNVAMTSWLWGNSEMMATWI
jgi:hypothetical protein